MRQPDNTSNCEAKTHTHTHTRKTRKYIIPCKSKSKEVLLARFVILLSIADYLVRRTNIQDLNLVVGQNKRYNSTFGEKRVQEN